MSPEEQQRKSDAALADYESVEDAVEASALGIIVVFSFLRPRSLFYLLMAAVTAYRLSMGITSD